MEKRTAVILCGGKGTRLGLVGKKIPKTLVKIHGKPIIWYIIKVLQKNNFNHFILPIGYKGAQIKEYFQGNNSFKDAKIEIVSTGISTSIARRIFKIKTKIISESFILLNGDAIFDFNINKTFQNHMQKKIDVTFIGCTANLPFGIIAKRKNKIIDFIRGDVKFNSVKKRNDNDFTGFVYSGISILKKKLLEKNFKNYENFEKFFYPPLIKKKKTDFEQILGFWHSIDNYKDINDVNIKNNKKNFNQIEKIIKKLK
jgi:glucose-1-phosphate cytidylyltransferase